MNYGTLKQCKASDIKSNLTKIFIDAEHAPVVINRRGSKPFILLTQEQFNDCSKNQSQEKEKRISTEEEGCEIDRYWDQYMNPEQNLASRDSSQAPSSQQTIIGKEAQVVETKQSEYKKHKKTLYYYLFEKYYY